MSSKELTQMVKKFSLVYTLAILSSVILSSNAARGDKFYIKGATDSDSVTFKSQATLETVVGITNNIVGFINFDPNKTDSASGRLRVDARTLNTGIGMRDDDMRKDHLETSKYPYIEFKLTAVSGLPATIANGPASPSPCARAWGITTASCTGYTNEFRVA